MSRGRAYPIIKRSSHIELILAEEKVAEVKVKKVTKPKKKVIKSKKS